MIKLEIRLIYEIAIFCYFKILKIILLYGKVLELVYGC